MMPAKKLGFGCMRLPLTDPEDFTKVDIAQVERMVDTFLERGFTYFDTAYMYHEFESEKIMRRTLVERHRRDSFTLASKLPTMFLKAEGDQERIFAEQLEKCGVGYFDYYLLHSVGGSIEDFNRRYIDNGMLDFMIEERKAGRIRNLGWSFHGDAHVFDHILALHDTVHWDFCQIQMNYSDWRNARGNNVDAEYLYQELDKREIPIIIMEPLLGGRLSNVPDHHRGAPEAAEPRQQRRIVGVPILGIDAARAYDPQRHDLHGAFAGQHTHILASGAAHPIPLRYGRTDAAISDHPVQRLQVLHAVPVRTRHTRHSAALQQVREREQYPLLVAGR